MLIFYFFQDEPANVVKEELFVDYSVLENKNVIYIEDDDSTLATSADVTVNEEFRNVADDDNYDEEKWTFQDIPSYFGNVSQQRQNEHFEFDENNHLKIVKEPYIDLSSDDSQSLSDVLYTQSILNTSQSAPTPSNMEETDDYFHHELHTLLNASSTPAIIRTPQTEVQTQPVIQSLIDDFHHELQSTVNSEPILFIKNKSQKAIQRPPLIESGIDKVSCESQSTLNSIPITSSANMQKNCLPISTDKEILPNTKNKNVVPDMDDFAKKKAIKKRNEAEDEVILCCKDVRKMNSEAIKLIQLQAEEINNRLGKHNENNLNHSYTNVVKPMNPPSGFLKLLYKEWASLTEDKQDTLFEKVLNEIEKFK